MIFVKYKAKKKSKPATTEFALSDKISTSYYFKSNIYF